MFISRTILGSRRISTQDCAFVQPVSSSVKKDLQRLDRRAVKVGGKITAPKAREWKMPEPKKQKVSPQNKKYLQSPNFF